MQVKEGVSFSELNASDITKLCHDERMIDVLKTAVPFIQRKNVSLILRKILKGNTKIIIEKNKRRRFKNRNSYVDRDGRILPEVINEVLKQLNEKIHEINDDVKDGDDVSVCQITKNLTYENMREMVCDEHGSIEFVFDFDSAIKKGKICNCTTLQRCDVQILSKPVKFDYPIMNVYRCPKCETGDDLEAYKTIGTDGRISCKGTYSYIDIDGKPKSKICNQGIKPDYEISITKAAYFYQIGYEDDDGNIQTGTAISFKHIMPGYYDCVLFKINNPGKIDYYHIMDVSEGGNNEFEFPQKSEENYVLTLVKHFDDFIYRQTGMKIFGMLPIKISLLLQAVFGYSKFPLIANMQLVGDSSTGKSMILKYYLFLLYGQHNLSTSGISVSIPGMRGTRSVVTLMSRDIKIITSGYLGSYKSIHIDEAGEEQELIQNLKTFLLEDNYGYNKAGSDNIVRRRTAQVCLSENLNHAHLGLYRGAIRKAYREMMFKIGNTDKELWNESWDLHKPLHEYDNLYLRKVIKEQRDNLMLQKKWWIDGYDYALHERFPFYFYLVCETANDKLMEVIKDNASNGVIRENIRIMNALKTKGISVFFEGLNNYIEGDDDRISFYEVDKILAEYGIQCDSRTRDFYYLLLRAIRMLNGRLKYDNSDYDILRYIIENTNCKLDINNTEKFILKGCPKNVIIEDVEVVDEFVLPEGEFDD